MLLYDVLNLNTSQSCIGIRIVYTNLIVLPTITYKYFKVLTDSNYYKLELELIHLIHKICII